MYERIASNVSLLTAVILFLLPMTPAESQPVRCPVTAADTTGWATHDEGNFTLKIPPRFEELKIKSIDSQMGKWKAGNATIWYDFGHYSYPVDTGERDSLSNLMVCQERQGPNSPRIAIYRDKDRGVVGMDAHWRVRLAGIHDGKALRINGAVPNEQSRAELLAVIQSVRFTPEKD